MAELPTTGPERQLLSFRTTAAASADAHALGQVGLARFDLVLDAGAIVLAIVLWLAGSVLLGLLVAVVAGLSLFGSRFHPFQRLMIGLRFRGVLGRTTQVAIDDEGLHFENSLGSTFIPWTSISDVRSNSRTVAFFHDRALLGYIPSSAFGSATAQATVADEARTRIARRSGEPGQVDGRES